MERVKEKTTQIFQEAVVEEHPLFTVIQANELSEQQVKEVALQLYHVVLAFPRFLAASISNIPHFSDRMSLVENLFEEHGRMNKHHVHSETYKQFLKGMAVTDEEIKKSRPTVGVIAYNRAILDLCLHYDWKEGVAALGVIEEIVARVSPLVAMMAKTRYRNNQAELAHFLEHETLDVEHANEIYEVVAGFYKEESEEVINQGFELGMYYHMKLYDDVLCYVRKIDVDNDAKHPHIHKYK
ncbi:TenA family transcriptional regulator [Alkalihalobacterium bogoriense]|uniref:TenA family transcriptional regulator n=1 Tax=Alkalihalobacterium bogoriense TaxID=246272 RepID=UPI0004792E30|nr:iron-containing redox enzyme family protein [Alkalihalobacterium bogoriense]